ncbi:MAG TPA: CBS domain-containing protein [Actinomycetota bacterium]|nr:CBS domain-containing protein [Actinomycetota bacterium]
MKLLRDIAIRHLVTVSPSSTIRRAARVMSDRGVGAAVVVERERVAGIVTERDILHSLAGGGDPDEVPVESIMTRDVVSGAPAWDVLRAVRVMNEGGFRHLLVMEMDDPIGIVSLRDLMDSIASLVDGSETD